LIRKVKNLNIYVSLLFNKLEPASGSRGGGLQIKINSKIFCIPLPMKHEPWNHLEKFYGFHYNYQKRLKFCKLGIICGILDQLNIFKEIKLENLNSIETFF